MPIFLNSVWQLNQGHLPFRVLMPMFLNSVTSRHDARLSSTTHCALRASRINYNLTNLSRCYSFLFFLLWTYAAPCRPAHFLLLLFQMLSSDSPGSLSPSCQNHQASCTKTANHTCNATATYSHMQLSRCHLFFTLTTTARNPTYRLHLANLSHSHGSQVFQPCNDLWYLPKICSRISQICLCISVSNSLR